MTVEGVKGPRQLRGQPAARDEQACAPMQFRVGHLPGGGADGKHLAPYVIAH